MRTKYLVIEETPELKKGAILIRPEGYEAYGCSDEMMLKDNTEETIFYSEKNVLEGKKWFKEITPSLWDKIVNKIIRTK